MRVEARGDEGTDPVNDDNYSILVVTARLTLRVILVSLLKVAVTQKHKQIVAWYQVGFELANCVFSDLLKYIEFDGLVEALSHYCILLAEAREPNGIYVFSNQGDFLI